VLTPKIGGIGRYAINLTTALLSISAREYPDMEFVIFTAPQTDRAVLNSLPARFCERFARVKSTLVRSSVLLPVGVATEGIDVFHGLDQAGIPFFFKKAKHVITLHDAIALVLPWTFPLKQRLVFSIALSQVNRQADVVFVPSESAKEDIARYLGISRERIVVVPYGCEERFRPEEEPGRSEAVRRKYKLPDRYVLFVSILQPRKNVKALVRAFAILRAERPDLDAKLVIAGGKGWEYEGLFANVESLGLRAQVRFTGFVDDEDLPDLYRGARLFVYPSLYEGFGLPILEAMASGVPVIASNVSSMPEVVGDAGLLVDPNDAEALAASMASVLDDAKLAEELRRRGLARARTFSWEAVALKTLEVYAALGGGHR
jgi:glycosyltransferase involved in cell wall biosynthesis